MADFSQYIIYADESGSPVLSPSTDEYPVFVLVFLIVEKRHYANVLVPQVQMLKFDFVGHDQLILHERDIRRQSGAFAFLQVSESLRANFLERVTKIVEEAQVKLCCAIIDKTKLLKRYENAWSPYDIAVTFCLEKAAKFLRQEGEAKTKVNVVFEARGANEDKRLELEFRRVADGNPQIGMPSSAVGEFDWKPLFIDKRSNSTGLQIADMAARPLGLSYLRPDQKNRASEVLKRKMVFPHPKCFP
jgi:Protein of unknown function (DUF3800)